MEDIETRTREFVRLFRQCTPWATAEMLGEVISDVDVRKSSKSQMAEDYAHGRYFSVHWADENAIYMIETDAGFDLADLLHALAVLEEKALGRIKHGVKRL